MLPDFLKYLRVNGYRVVHVVPMPKHAETHVDATEGSKAH
jgi:hypothetical protein